MILRRAGAAALATTAALAAVSQAAIAAPRPELTIRGLSVAGPELAGGAILWGQRVAGGATVLRRRDDDGSTRTLFSTPPPPARRHAAERTSTWIGSVVASASRVAFEYGFTGIARHGLARAASPVTIIRVSGTLVVGPPDGPFAHVAGDLPPGEPCRGESTSSGDFALDSSVLAYGEVSDSCADPRTGDIRVVVAAPHTRWMVGQLESGPASHVAVAGRHVAFIEPASQRPAVSVYDWASGRLDYWIPHPSGRPYLREVELARDGQWRS
ncbi:MAG: hypothetical protein M3141_01100 [Actinomycetota bacterium]|nr:hypothetical protein [Actinomycetota bacterium]